MYKNDDFTKTGSGQIYRESTQKEVAAFQRGWEDDWDHALGKEKQRQVPLHFVM